MEAPKTISVKCTASNFVPLDDIHPMQGELKTLGKREFEKLKKSLIRYGITFPIFLWLHNGRNLIVDGTQRDRVLTLMREEGYEIPPLPADFIEAKNEKEAKEKILLLSSQYGKMDESSLHDFILEADLDFPELKEVLELPQINLDHFEQGWMTDEVVEDEAPELPAKAITRMGDLWILGDHRVLCGDSTRADDVAKVMDGEKAHLVFTDPPYGVGYDGGAKKREKLSGDEIGTTIYFDSLKHLSFAADDEASLYLWYADGHAAAAAAAAAAAGYQIVAQIIWLKNNAQFVTSAHYKGKHEPCYYGHRRNKTSRWYGPNNEVTVWEIDRANKNEFHPTQKPVALAARAIRNSSIEKQIVLDMFLGSASTLIAAEELGRRCFGIDIEPRYIDVTITRYLNLRPDAKILRNGKPIDWKKLVEERDKKSAA